MSIYHMITDRWTRPMIEKHIAQGREQARQEGYDETYAEGNQQGRKEGYREGYQESHQQAFEEGRAEVRAWYRRQLEAEANGEPFSEPPPNTTPASNDDAKAMTATASGVPVRITPGGRRPQEDYLLLTTGELAWLDKFRKQMMAEFPGSLTDIIVRGFRTRGMADEDLEVNVLIVYDDERPADMDRVHQLAFDLSLEADPYPTVMTVLKSELEREFYRSRTKNGISVL